MVDRRASESGGTILRRPHDDLTSGPGVASVAEFLAWRATTTPQAQALAVAGKPALTFRRWEARSNAVARGLAVAGVGSGVRVALVLDGDEWPELAVGYVAVLKVGAVAVPLGLRLGAMDLDRVLADCDPSVVVSGPALGPQADGRLWRSLTDLEAGQSSATLDLVPAAGVAEIRYPPGTLRRPEPYRSSHGDLSALLAGHGPGGSASPWLRFWPAHPGGFVHGFAPGSGAASAALLAPLGAGRGPSISLGAGGPLGSINPSRLCAVVSERRPTVAGVSSATARALIATGSNFGRDLSSLTRLVISGDPGSEPLEALAAALPGATVSVLGSRPPGDAGASRGSRVGGAVLAPVASSQIGMVWHEQFAPGSFNLAPLVRRYRGPLNAAAMEAALGEIIARHDALRATFSIVGGHAVQVVAPATPFALPVIDVSGWAKTEGESELGRLISEARTHPADLVTGPLFAPSLVRLGVDDHVMIIRVHHSVFDDSSVGPFRAELSVLYQAFAAGLPSPLAPHDLTFAQVCRDKSRALDGATGVVERSFWHHELGGAPVTLELPLGDPEQPVGANLPACAPVRVEMDADVARTLRALARHERATVFMVMLAAFAATVGRYCDAEDLVMSTLVGDRDSLETKDMIGCFAKKVLVRLSLAGDPTFVELIGRARDSVMAAITHKQLAFETVVQDNLGAVAAVHGMAAQVSVKFQAAVSVGQRLSLPGLTISRVTEAAPVPPPHFLAREPATDPERPAQVWGAGLYAATFLGLSIAETDDSLALIAEGVFHPPALRRLLRHVATLAAEVARSPARPISTLSMLDDADLSELYRWSAGPTVAGRAAGIDVDRLISQRAAHSPQRVVLTGDDHVSLADLDARVAHLADRLRDAGAAPGTVVGICLGAGVAAVTAALAVWRTGAAYAGLDPGAGEARLGLMLAGAAVDIVVADRGGTTAVAGLRAGLLIIDPEDRANAQEGASNQLAGDGVSQRRAAVSVGHDDLACVFYRQDSNGPVGVDIEHSALINTGIGISATVDSAVSGTEVGPRLRWVSTASPADEGFMRALIALSQGHSVHFTRPAAAAMSATVVSLLAAGSVDAVECTPAELRGLLAAGLQAGLAIRPRSRPVATVVMVSLSSFDTDLWWDIARMSDVAVHHLYGPPECGFGATVCKAGSAPARVSVGRPLANVSARVLDRVGRAVPVGVLGELHVGGAGIARGYRKRPQRDAQQFVTEGGEGGRLWRSGQRARLLPDGNVELLGALGDTEDLDGFAVEPARIQAALADCPGVSRVAVVLREDIPGQRRLVAYIVASTDTPAPSLRQLRRHLWTRLPGYAWPAAVVAVDVLADGPGGLDVGALPAPDDADDEVGVEAAALAALWAESGGDDVVVGGGNYWQSFSFLDAVAAAVQSGVKIDARMVTRNRTLQTLATDLAAGEANRRQPDGLDQ